MGIRAVPQATYSHRYTGLKDRMHRHSPGCIAIVGKPARFPKSARTTRGKLAQLTVWDVQRRRAMHLPREQQLLLTRRQLFGRTAAGIGTAALAALLNERLFAADADVSLQTHGVLPALHFAPKAKRVIYLFMSGGPSHIDLFDYKPKLKDYHGKELPGSVRMGQRVTGMTAFQKSFPCVAPMFQFAQHGRSGA